MSENAIVAVKHCCVCEILLLPGDYIIWAKDRPYCLQCARSILGSITDPIDGISEDIHGRVCSKCGRYITLGNVGVIASDRLYCLDCAQHRMDEIVKDQRQFHIVRSELKALMAMRTLRGRIVHLIANYQFDIVGIGNDGMMDIEMCKAIVRNTLEGVAHNIERLPLIEEMEEV